MNMRWLPGSDIKLRREPIGPTFWLTLFTVAACLAFGGASRNNAWQACGLLLASLPLLGWSIWRLTQSGRWRSLRLPLLIVIAAAMIPILQLVPLPFEIWAGVAGHDAAAQVLRLAGPEGWLAYSLDPHGTARALFFLAPPIAVFLGVLDLTDRERRLLLLVAPAAAIVSLMIGVVQITQGPESPFYFYSPTNQYSAVGLFSNRNHQATLFVVCLPLIATWVSALRGPPRHRLVFGAIAISVLMLMILGLAIVQSRAGILLLGPGIAASLFLLWKRDPDDKHGAAFGIVGAGLAAGLVAAALVLRPIIERFASDVDGGRSVVTPTTLKAALEYLPFGSGLGSFTSIYAGIEPVDQMTEAFWNHAHNDYAELWLETGLLGLVCLALFLVWWASAVFGAWRSKADNFPQVLAGAVITMLMLAHSAVDYPLRTLGLVVVFALACGLMTTPASSAYSLAVTAAEPRRRRSRRKSD